MIQGGFFQSAHVSFGENFAADRNPVVWFAHADVICFARGLLFVVA